MEILSDVKPDDFPFDWYAIAHDDHFWFKSRMDAFMRFSAPHLNPKAELRLMEIGCGNGLVRRQLEKRTSWIIDGCDINENALKLNQGLRGKTYLYNIHEHYPDFKNAYDAIILFDVLEHIPDTRGFLESVFYHLKPGGLLFINVPALNQYKSDYDEAVGHIRRYDQSMMAQEFHSFPVKVIGQRYWAMGLLPALILRKKFVRNRGNVKDLVEKGLQPPNGLVNRMLYALLKTENALFSNPISGASLMAAVRKEYEQ